MHEKIEGYRRRWKDVLEEYLTLLQKQEPLIREGSLDGLEPTMVREAELVGEIESLERVIRTLRIAADSESVERAGREGGPRRSGVSENGTSENGTSVPLGAREAPKKSGPLAPWDESEAVIWQAILDQHAINRDLLARRKTELGEQMKGVRVPRRARSVYRQRGTGSRIDLTQ